MLDTSDRAIFNHGYDPSMGTTGFSVDVNDAAPTIVLIFDKERRGFLITNVGPATVYCSLTTEVSPDLYSFRLRPHGIFGMSGYGGIVTAICDGGSAELYVTDVH